MLRRGFRALAGWRSLSTRLQLGGEGDTICHLSSGADRAGIAVIRVSGSRAFDAFCALARRSKPPHARFASQCSLFTPDSAEKLDTHSLAIAFPQPHSFTGEDVVEFHVHGSPIVVHSVLSALQQLPSVRLAHPGEFTQRAFEHGKLDLTQAEALCDLINADTESQHAQAMTHMDGALSRLYGDWRTQLVNQLAQIEAILDFADDEYDVEEARVLKNVLFEVETLRGLLRNHLTSSHRGKLVRDGVNVCIAGPPNVGKSTLFNWLAQRPAAIVDPFPGTTRDIVSTHINLSGYSVHIHDTAGLREAEDGVEQEGMRRAVQCANESDMQVVVLSAPDLAKNEEKEEKEETPSAVEEMLKEALVVVNKSDLVEEDWSPPSFLKSAVVVSCETENGLPTLLSKLEDKIKSQLRPETDTPLLTRQRHRVHVENCVDALDQFEKHAGAAEFELAAEVLREAAEELGRISCVIDSEDVLDEIFRRFCIGK